jgi:hypothetical protein
MGSAALCQERESCERRIQSRGSEKEKCQNTSSVEREKKKYVNSLTRMLRREEEVLYDTLIKIKMYKYVLSKI